MSCLWSGPVFLQVQLSNDRLDALSLLDRGVFAEMKLGDVLHPNLATERGTKMGRRRTQRRAGLLLELRLRILGGRRVDLACTDWLRARRRERFGCSRPESSAE